MADPISTRTVDLAAIVAANLMNLIMVGVFVARIAKPGHSRIVAAIWVILILVLGAVGALNATRGRPWWATALPLILAVFLIVEVILDYILSYDFRSTRWLGPYLLLYYAGIMGMIGYSFQVEKKWGFVTLATYFLSQIAALYSYFKVGHGS